MSAKIAKALHEVMSKVGYVQKTGKNAFHGYKYAGEADLLDKLRPAMVDAGLMLIPSQRDIAAPDAHGNVTVAVEYTLIHKDGDIWPEKIVGYGCGNDLSPKTGRIGDKGLYKAITGANKYVLFKLFQIETGDDPEQDNRIETEPVSAPRQSPRPIETPKVPTGPAPSNTLSRLLAKLSDLPDIESYDRFVGQAKVDQAILSLSPEEGDEWRAAVFKFRAKHTFSEAAE